MSGRISLDTNIVIRLFKNDPEITRMLAAVSTLCLPVPVIAEILFTARNSSRQKENLKNDLWIASICREHNLPLLTGDAHFDNINDL